MSDGIACFVCGEPCSRGFISSHLAQRHPEAQFAIAPGMDPAVVQEMVEFVRGIAASSGLQGGDRLVGRVVGDGLSDEARALLAKLEAKP